MRLDKVLKKGGEEFFLEFRRLCLILVLDFVLSLGKAAEGKRDLLGGKYKHPEENLWMTGIIRVYESAKKSFKLLRGFVFNFHGLWV